jgi:hypothetical protein
LEIRFTHEALALVGHDKDDRGIVQYDQTPDQQALDTWPGIWDEQGTMYAVYDFLEPSVPTCLAVAARIAGIHASRIPTSRLEFRMITARSSGQAGLRIVLPTQGLGNDANRSSSIPVAAGN